MARRTRYCDSVMRRSIVLFGCIAAILAGCASTPEPIDEPVDRTELLIRRIETALEQDVGAVDWISRGAERALLDEATEAQLWQRVLDRQLADYRDAISAEDFGAAYVAANNLRHLRERDVADETATVQTTDEILHRWAESELDRGSLQQAVYLQTRRSFVSDLTDDALIAYRDAAIAVNNYAVAERLGRVADRRDLAVAPLPPRPDARAMLSGTVTIWVNRGIVIENGVGFPDRVIGSGFFVDPRGYLLTNHHVIASEVDPEYEGFSRLFVKLPGRPDERLPARVIGYDRVFDLALLKVEYDAPFVFSPPARSILTRVRRSWRSVRPAVWTARSPPESCPLPRGASCNSATSCRWMRRSTPATAAVRWSTRALICSAWYLPVSNSSKGSTSPYHQERYVTYCRVCSSRASWITSGSAWRSARSATAWL